MSLHAAAHRTPRDRLFAGRGGQTTMILLYSFLLFVLSLAAWLMTQRARRLERKFERLAAATEKILREPVFRQGNSTKPDLCMAAKRYYVLGQMIQKRDRLEAKHENWQILADRASGAVQRVRDWKGKKLPYTFGALDVSAFLYALDTLGARDFVNVRLVLDQLVSWIGR